MQKTLWLMRTGDAFELLTLCEAWVQIGDLRKSGIPGGAPMRQEYER
jgi:hypothetical protein